VATLLALPEPTTIQVMEELRRLGFDCKEDMKFLEPEKDLKDVLTVLQCRKFAAKLKEKFGKHALCIYIINFSKMTWPQLYVPSS
jgi:hypothetical protein